MEYSEQWIFLIFMDDPFYDGNRLVLILNINGR